MEQPKKQLKSIKEAFSYTTQVNGQTWDPTQGKAPFRVMSGLGYLEDTIKGIPRRDEEEAKAPKILPFPLDRITDQLAKAYEDFMIIRQTLMVTIKSALLSKQEKALLRLDIKYVDRCLDTIKKISMDIEKVQL